MAGAGGIFRDHNGSWIYGYSRRVGFTTSLAAELWAIRDGLDIAVNRGISKLILETDSKVAETLLKSANHNFHSLGVLIRDCRRLMQEVFQGFFSEDKERIVKIMERVTSSGFSKVAKLMETLLDSSVKEDAMGKRGQSLDVPVSAFPFVGLEGNKSELYEFLGITEEDVENLPYFIEKVREEGVSKAREFVNGGHPFAQFQWVKKAVDLMGLNMMDVHGGLALVDYLKEANREFMKKQKLCSVYYPTVPAFPILGFFIPKKWRSKGAKPLIITTGSGFLSKFGAPVKDFETRFFDAKLVERRGNKSQKRCRESEESEKEKLNKPKRQRDGKIQNNRVMAQLAEWGLLPPPNMPTEFKNLIEEMGENQVMVDFLTEEEERKLDEKGLNVELIEPCLKKSTIHLTKWNMKNSRVFVFNEQWNSVVNGNQSTLKKNIVVQIWSFRTAPNSKLCFAMVKVKDGDDY
ncbi:hypothetical protein SLEP1_g10590 [Rubroshorea leprosula]|uniref:RNase H type-1 domain-containing protein n=1 Tax=Rubroshorea leprosula TaxID=152421 RepID=A0AAV5IIH0_9ROSI|nr:hypothetical protein SLEP1_g10590 [Rubroshorea leprosula]